MGRFPFIVNQFIRLIKTDKEISKLQDVGDGWERDLACKMVLQLRRGSSLLAERGKHVYTNRSLSCDVSALKKSIWHIVEIKCLNHRTTLDKDSLDNLIIRQSKDMIKLDCNGLHNKTVTGKYTVTTAALFQQDDIERYYKCGKKRTTRNGKGKDADLNKVNGQMAKLDIQDRKKLGGQKGKKLEGKITTLIDAQRKVKLNAQVEDKLDEQQGDRLDAPHREKLGVPEALKLVQKTFGKRSILTMSKKLKDFDFRIVYLGDGIYMSWCQVRGNNGLRPTDKIAEPRS